MSVPLQLILAYALGMLALYAIGWLLLVPFKFLSRLMLNGLFGGLLLVLLHMLSGFWNITIGLNPITALVAGFLGVPGVALLLLIPALTGL
jgi:inhibitor of the pro-sigma K processing machinery